jgi:hypothetical protein
MPRCPRSSAARGTAQQVKPSLPVSHPQTHTEPFRCSLNDRAPPMICIIVIAIVIIIASSSSLRAYPAPAVTVDDLVGVLAHLPTSSQRLVIHATLEDGLTRQCLCLMTITVMVIGTADTHTLRPVGSGDGILDEASGRVADELSTSHAAPSVDEFPMIRSHDHRVMKLVIINLLLLPSALL